MPCLLSIHRPKVHGPLYYLENTVRAYDHLPHFANFDIRKHNQFHRLGHDSCGELGTKRSETKRCVFGPPRNTRGWCLDIRLKYYSVDFLLQALAVAEATATILACLPITQGIIYRIMEKGLMNTRTQKKPSASMPSHTDPFQAQLKQGE